MTDWNLIIQGNISLLWIQETLKPENNNKTINELLEAFKNKYEQTEPLNIGTLFMAAYLLFLYPKENEFDKIDKSKIDTSGFQITINENTQNKIVNSDYKCGRIRNSIAHGNFSVNNLSIEFEDWMPNKKGQKPNHFKATIGVGKFGNFINNFMLEVKNQLIK